MDIEQCWNHYIKAEELNQQGHWPEAHHLYHNALEGFPACIQGAVVSDSTKPCQLMCLLDGFKNATVNQSEILNNLGKNEEAFALLNQTYNYIQFLKLETTDLLRSVNQLLNQHSEMLFRHIIAFCTAQRSASWMLELETLQKAHHHFFNLQQYNTLEQPATLN